MLSPFPDQWGGFARVCIASRDHYSAGIPSVTALRRWADHVHGVSLAPTAGRLDRACVIRIDHYCTHLAPVRSDEQRNSPLVGALRGQWTISGDLPSQGTGQAGQCVDPIVPVLSIVAFSHRPRYDAWRILISRHGFLCESG